MSPCFLPYLSLQSCSSICVLFLERIIRNYRLNKANLNSFQPIGGDGNCFYRAIAYITTGDENNYRQVKRSIFDFMRVNKVIMIEIERAQISYHYFSESDRSAILGLSPIEVVSERQFQEVYPAVERIEKFLEYFQQDGVWGNSTIATYTALMLKTNFQTFCLGGPAVTGDAWFVNQHRNEMNTPYWRKWKGFLTYPAQFEPTVDMEMYLQWRNGNHYEAACRGIARSNLITRVSRRRRKPAIR